MFNKSVTSLYVWIVAQQFNGLHSYDIFMKNLIVYSIELITSYVPI